MYVLEKFLARVAVSEHSDRLKGGMLLAVGDARRATVDADFLARNLHLDEDAVLRRVVEIASLPAPTEDGVVFRVDTATACTIRDGDLYGGIRVTMLTRSRRHRPRSTTRRCCRTTPAVRVLGYPLPVVLAEKLCTAVELGAGNSRVRDYADIWTLTRSHDVRAADLLTAVATTSRHRGVQLRPLRVVLHDYGTARARAFDAYRRRLGPDAAKRPGSFAVVVQHLIAFADPALGGDLEGYATWRAGSSIWS